MKKVFLGVGHGGSDPGAVGYLKEADVNLNMALGCKEYLEKNNVEVKLSRYKDENDSLNEEIRECNAYNPDLAVDIHNNAGGGDGFEAYYGYKDELSKKLALNIETEIKAIGQNSRGCKTRLNSKGNADYYGFIRNTKVSAVITEGLFVDNANDVKIADTVEEQRVFGVAIAKGILKTLDITPQDKPTTPIAPSNVVVHVAVTANVLNIRAGAGTNYKVVTQAKKGGEYDVYEIKGDWGKINGGWFNLDYTTYNPSPKNESVNYLVRINTYTLNVRDGAGTTYKINTTVKQSEIYTIVEEKNGWGKLKSGAGWIKLSYTVRV